MSGPATTAPAPGATPAACERLVLFDGVCGFCDRLVGFLIERDAAERLRFAPLQGETAAALRARHQVHDRGARGVSRFHTTSEASSNVCAGKSW